METAKPGSPLVSRRIAVLLARFLAGFSAERCINSIWEIGGILGRVSPPFDCIG